jgi:hypothetical protein
MSLQLNAPIAEAPSLRTPCAGSQRRHHGDRRLETGEGSAGERAVRRREGAERFAERRRVEDEAPRLRAVVPRLTDCRIEIEDTRMEQTSAGITYTRRIVVAHAPALLVIPCGDSSCRDGGHDITSELLRGLRAGLREVTGEDTCYGRIGTANCGRVLRFTAFAEYGSAP